MKGVLINFEKIHRKPPAPESFFKKIVGLGPYLRLWLKPQNYCFTEGWFVRSFINTFEELFLKDIVTQDLERILFKKKLQQVCSCEYYEFFKNICFEEYLRTAASDITRFIEMGLLYSET